MATTYFISRHPGAVEWARARGFAVDEILAHFTPASLARLQPGDVVMGTLPIHLAAQVCAAGAQYFHLSLELPPALRGKELTTADMEACGARLERFHVEAFLS